MQLLALETRNVSAFLTLIGGGCREADVGSDALKIRLLETKVEAKRGIGYILVGRPDWFVMLVLN